MRVGMMVLAPLAIRNTFADMEPAAADACGKDLNPVRVEGALGPFPSGALAPCHVVGACAGSAVSRY